MEGRHYVQEAVVFYQKTCQAFNLIFREHLHLRWLSITGGTQIKMKSPGNKAYVPTKSLKMFQVQFNNQQCIIRHSSRAFFKIYF